MAAIILAIVIFGSIVLGMISIAVHLYHDGKKDSEYWELFKGK